MSEPSKPPERLFRYFSPPNSEIFTERKLWFSEASDFNDIFEVYPRYDVLIPEMVDEMLRKDFVFSTPATTSFQEFRQRKRLGRQTIIEWCNNEYPEAFQTKFSAYYGIVCFSEHLNNLLMWGHYTRSHRGFVVEFDPQHQLFTPRDFAKVVYHEDRPVLNREANSGMLLRKSPEWAYEDEHRLVRPKSELTPGIRIVDGKETDRHFVPLPMDAIKAVYFGCRISPQDRLNLQNPLKAFPDVGQFFMRRNRIAYTLDVVPWKEWVEPNESDKKLFTLPWVFPPS